MALLSSKNSSEKKLKQFQTYWLEENLFKDFLCKVKDDSTKFRCKICQRTLTLSTEGRPAIVRHVEGQKHTAAMKRVKNIFAKTKPIDKVCTDNENRKLALTQDIKDIQKKQTVIEKAMQSMNDEAEECFKRAVKKNDMALVVKGNSLKRSCEESKSELLKLEEIQKDLVEKRKKLC